MVVTEHEQYKTGALKRKRQVKQSGNILKNITIIWNIHMYNMHKSVEKYIDGFESEDP